MEDLTQCDTELGKFRECRIKRGFLKRFKFV